MGWMEAPPFWESTVKLPQTGVTRGGRQGFYVSVREMVNTLGCYHPADCGQARAILSLLSLAPAVFFHPGQAGNQLSCQMRIPTGFFRLAIHFHGNKQTTRCLNSNTRVRWYSCCCLQEIFFYSAAQFFLGLRLIYSEKSSYSQPSGKLASKGVISDSSVQFWWNIIPVEWQEDDNWARDSGPWSHHTSPLLRILSKCRLVCPSESLVKVYKWVKNCLVSLGGLSVSLRGSQRCLRVLWGVSQDLVQTNLLTRYSVWLHLCLDIRPGSSTCGPSV